MVHCSVYLTAHRHPRVSRSPYRPATRSHPSAGLRGRRYAYRQDGAKLSAGRPINGISRGALGPPPKLDGSHLRPVRLVPARHFARPMPACALRRSLWSRRIRFSEV
jgi:hypothetical protein